MVDILIKIISILGIILLVLLCTCLVLLLLVLFMPVTYRITGKQKGEERSLLVKAKWLFGLLHVKYAYPEPGSVRVRLLGFTVFDSKAEKKEKPPKEKKPEKEKSPKEKKKKANIEANDKTGAKEEPANISSSANPNENPVNQQNIKEKENLAENTATNTVENTAESTNTEAGSDVSLLDKIKAFILEKYNKILYTFQNIYDKIKHIWENITYYTELLQEEDTKLLFGHGLMRLGKILKSIRPRRLKADIVFGTGAPDTTGYAYAGYCMLLPWLGNKVLVTPDFEEKILEGELFAAGHITVFTLLRHGVLFALDKKLRVFIHKAKAGRN